MNVVRLKEEDVRNIPDSAYRLVRQNEDFQYWEARVELPNGLMGTVQKTVFLGAEQLLSENEEMRKESSNRRYTHGMGSDKGGNMPMVQTASIPLNIYYREIAPYNQKGDKDFLRNWLRRPENAHFRTNTGETRK